MNYLTLSVTGFYEASGDVISQRHPGAEFVAVVTEATRKAERDYQDLWAFKGEFKTARALVRSLGIAQDLTSPSAVY